MKPLLILDIDETLVYSQEVENYNGQPYDFQIGRDFITKKRPYVDDFINKIKEEYILAIWTAGTKDYADGIVQNLFEEKNIPLEFIKSRNDCIKRSMIDYDDYKYNCEYYYIKDLRRIKKKYNLNRTLIVDDLPIGIRRHYGNLVQINPFKGNENDNELNILYEYLLDIKDETNFRKLNKYSWRDKTVQKTQEKEFENFKF